MAKLGGDPQVRARHIRRFGCPSTLSIVGAMSRSDPPGSTAPFHRRLPK